MVKVKEKEKEAAMEWNVQEKGACNLGTCSLDLVRVYLYIRTVEYINTDVDSK
jgi:hypothetical protein